MEELIRGVEVAILITTMLLTMLLSFITATATATATETSISIVITGIRGVIGVRISIRKHLQ